MIHHPLMHRVVVTGGPGAGKTTLLKELAARGYATVPESAREVIAARVTQGLPPRPDPVTFANEIFQKDDEKYRCPPRSTKPTFYDRSVVEALGMVHEGSPLPENELRAKVSSYTFYRTVFILPPWQAIFVNDSERDQAFSHAVAVHGQVVRWYQWCGYQLNEVPRLEIGDRASYVLQALAIE